MADSYKNLPSVASGGDRPQATRVPAEARAKIEARAKERFEREQAEHQAKLAERAAKAAATGKKPSGRAPQRPVECPLPTDQLNLSDEESRIMPVAGGGFEQCYHAQAVVAADGLLVVATGVVQAANDKQQLEPMVAQQGSPDELGTVGFRQFLLRGLERLRGEWSLVTMAPAFARAGSGT